MVSTLASAGSPWLSLGQASRLLGITPATLRRWSDQGEVATFVTPGGHRRFARTVIEGMVPRVRARRPPLAGLGASPERMAQAYRRARPVEHGGKPWWLAALSDADRVEFRDRGRHLLAVVLEHLDAEDRPLAAQKLEQAAAGAGEYGSRAAALGAPLAESVELFLRFRSSFVGELARVARRRRLDTREATVLLVEAESAMDRLLVALMNGYENRGTGA
ncbi:MAG TPA: helix-turn-helix domain-containing protein [Candidatus Dormibacteraeota bacterium]